MRLGAETLPPVHAGTSEKQARVDLAALYRLVALQGWDDLLLTHISARIPGPEGHFLINPFGLRFSEITASSLAKVDQSGQRLDGKTGRINRAGFLIHSAIHRARDDAHFIIHLHSDDGVAVASQADGLLPLNQRALQVLRGLAYHDYTGVVSDAEEQEGIVRDLGDGNAMILRNHGTLALGQTAGAAWLAIYALEKACITQVKALSAGRDGLLPAPAEVQDRVVNAAPSPRRAETAAFAWAALLRQLEVESPGYDA